MADLNELGIGGSEAQQLKHWWAKPVADRWVFEQIKAVLDKVLGDLPSRTHPNEFWLGENGQFFAELLWDCCPEDDRLRKSEAITYAYGEPEDYKAWRKLYMRLERAAQFGHIHAFRLPERDLVRRKNSTKEQGRWYDRLELDALKGK